MSEKILVADDSPTIQKVVGITLANTDYELVQAQSEEDMMSSLGADKYDLLLLDFNLSETKDGYELCQKVHEVAPGLKVMIMLGTFDTVEDHRLEGLGVVDRVIKPFESSKFIKKVKDSLELGADDSDDFSSDDGFTSLEENNPFDSENSDNDSSESIDDLEDEWTISGPQVEEDDEPMPEGNFLEEGNPNIQNELASEVQGWGMSVPGVIGQASDAGPVMPGAIGETSSDSFSLGQVGVSEDSLSQENVTGEWDASKLMTEEETDVMPNDDDLDYPDMDMSSEDTSESTDRPSSSLVSLDELTEDDDDEEELEATDPQIVIAPAEDSADLVAALDDDDDGGDFWAADESYDPDQESSEEGLKIGPNDEDESSSFTVEEHSPVEVGPKLEDESQSPIVESLNDLHDREEEFTVDEVSASSSNIGLDKSEIIAALREEFKPLLKEMVKEVIEEMGRETSEKIAWEVIPDLAENLIRAEVEKLSQKVQEKHSLS
jgi:CheY-like chemotaxis protein